MNNIPLFDNIQYTDHETGFLTESVLNNQTQLFQALQRYNSTFISNDASDDVLQPDRNTTVQSSVLKTIPLPKTCGIGSTMTVTNPYTGAGFLITINPGQHIQYLSTIGSISLKMLDAGSAVTLYCVNPDTDFLVISHEGTITLV